MPFDETKKPEEKVGAPNLEIPERPEESAARETPKENLDGKVRADRELKILHESITLEPINDEVSIKLEKGKTNTEEDVIKGEIIKYELELAKDKLALAREEERLRILSEKYSALPWYGKIGEAIRYKSVLLSSIARREKAISELRSSIRMIPGIIDSREEELEKLQGKK